MSVIAFSSAFFNTARAKEQETTTPGGALAGQRPRLVVSTDIGGTDPDDYQSLVHLLVYADVLDIEGIISSPYGPGRKAHILEVIDCYQQDYANLKTYSDAYPTPDALRELTKQGEAERAPYSGVRRSTYGSDWIVRCARRKDSRPLHMLIWGGIEDLAQALHDAPDILPTLRVYWIGGPNKKWSPDAYQYLVENHPNLWIIESNSTYRGWFTGGNQSGAWGNRAFVSQHVAGKGALGDLYARKMPELKMGDSPSVGWILNGNSADPTQPGWGGSYVHAWDRPYVRLDRIPTEDDHIEAFGILEIVLPIGGETSSSPKAVMQVENQRLAGQPFEDGTIRFRFCPKRAGIFRFEFTSNIPTLDSSAGEITALPPKPAIAQRPSTRFPNWWTDDLSQHMTEGPHSGAKTVSRWREAFLQDFSQRMRRCQSPADAFNAQ